MTARGALRRGQRMAESLMTATVTIRKPETKTLDPNSGKYVETAGETVYSGPANVKTDELAARQAVAGGESVVVAPILVKLPWKSSVEALPGYVVTVDASNDPVQVGRKLLVTVGAVSSLGATCRRLTCTDVLDD